MVTETSAGKQTVVFKGICCQLHPFLCMLMGSFSWKGFCSISVPFLSFSNVYLRSFLLPINSKMFLVLHVWDYRIKLDISCWFLRDFFKFGFILPSGRTGSYFIITILQKKNSRKSMRLDLGILRLPFIILSPFLLYQLFFFFKISTWIWVLLILLHNLKGMKKLFSF